MGSRAFAAACAVAVALLLGGCGSSNNSPTAPSPPTGGGGGAANVTITISGMNGPQSYNPSAATVKVGQTVAWHNADAVTHTATADGGAFNTGNIAAGSTSAPIMMSAAGTFTYHCAIHPSMTGTLTVTP